MSLLGQLGDRTAPAAGPEDSPRRPADGVRIAPRAATGAWPGPRPGGEGERLGSLRKEVGEVPQVLVALEEVPEDALDVLFAQAKEPGHVIWVASR